MAALKRNQFKALVHNVTEDVQTAPPHVTAIPTSEFNAQRENDCFLNRPNQRQFALSSFKNNASGALMEITLSPAQIHSLRVRYEPDSHEQPLNYQEIRVRTVEEFRNYYVRTVLPSQELWRNAYQFIPQDLIQDDSEGVRHFDIANKGFNHSLKRNKVFEEEEEISEGGSIAQSSSADDDSFTNTGGTTIDNAPPPAKKRVGKQDGLARRPVTRAYDQYLLRDHQQQ